ncbi:hypothetical protein PRIPAC_71481, partial [Pristionchus pacificus]|uniref:Plasma membrane fusion protein PRM1 n=1 Tax=Pristionchus pacificus TaxID=54126 RepID=A0A8R1UPD3_PRIPA
MPTPSPVDRSIDSVCKNYKDDQCKEAFKTLQTFAQSVTDPMVVDEKVGESLVDVAYKIGASFEDLGAMFTQITDRSVASANDIRKAAADWFRFPLDIQQHIDSTANYAMQLTTMVEMLIFAFKILVVVMIVRVIFENRHSRAKAEKFLGKLQANEEIVLSLSLSDVGNTLTLQMQSLRMTVADMADVRPTVETLLEQVKADVGKAFAVKKLTGAVVVSSKKLAGTLDSISENAFGKVQEIRQDFNSWFTFANDIDQWAGMIADAIMLMLGCALMGVFIVRCVLEMILDIVDMCAYCHEEHSKDDPEVVIARVK